KSAMARYPFDDVTARLKAAGVGCTEVLPLERVLEAEQARQPGKLRGVAYRGLDFEIPEFPRLYAEDTAAETLPPPELGEHTLALLRAAGLPAEQCEALLASGAIMGKRDDTFAWAPVRDKR